MNNLKLEGSLNAKSSLSASINSKGNIEGNIGKGVIKVSVNDHNILINRDLPDQHPIEAVTGLKDELMSIKNSQSDINLSIKSLNTKIDNKIRTVKQVPSDMIAGEYIFLEKGEL